MICLSIYLSIVCLSLLRWFCKRHSWKGKKRASRLSILSLECLNLCPMEKVAVHVVGMTWGRVNNEKCSSVSFLPSFRASQASIFHFSVRNGVCLDIEYWLERHLHVSGFRLSFIVSGMTALVNEEWPVCACNSCGSASLGNTGSLWALKPPALLCFHNERFSQWERSSPERAINRLAGCRPC